MLKEKVNYYCKCYRNLYGVGVFDYNLYINLILGNLMDLDEV